MNTVTIPAHIVAGFVPDGLGRVFGAALYVRRGDGHGEFVIRGFHTVDEITETVARYVAAGFDPSRMHVSADTIG